MVEGSVVVVGHGCSPVGKGWGTTIDSFDSVVRLWNWTWQNEEDYGRRYDYGYYEVLSTEMKRLLIYNTELPAKHWIAGRTGNRKSIAYEGDLVDNSVEINTAPWEWLGVYMGGFGTKGKLGLTRGVCAAAWAIGEMQPGETLVLVGFDNVKQGWGLKLHEAFPAAYLNHESVSPVRDYVGDVAKYGNHDYKIEGPLLEKLSCRRGVHLQFAQDIWQ